MLLTQAERAAPERVELCGTYRHAVDPKGRVAVPALLRRGLPEGSVVAPGPDHRLVVWPPDEWQKEQDRYRRTAESPSQQRRFLRQLAGHTFPFELDSQGRLLLTAAQRAWAAIEDVAVFTGLATGVEIVGEQLWNADQLDLDPDEFTRLHDLVHRSAEAPTGAPQ
jgi:MraZ protein